MLVPIASQNWSSKSTSTKQWINKFIQLCFTVLLEHFFNQIKLASSPCVQNLVAVRSPTPQFSKWNAPGGHLCKCEHSDPLSTKKKTKKTKVFILFYFLSLKTKKKTRFFCICWTPSLFINGWRTHWTTTVLATKTLPFLLSGLFVSAEHTTSQAWTAVRAVQWCFPQSPTVVSTITSKVLLGDTICAPIAASVLCIV